jgi:hypothetical protein
MALLCIKDPNLFTMRNFLRALTILGKQAQGERGREMGWALWKNQKGSLKKKHINKTKFVHFIVHRAAHHLKGNIQNRVRNKEFSMQPMEKLHHGVKGASL